MTPSAEAMAAYAALPEGEQCFKYAWCAGYDAMRASLGEPEAYLCTGPYGGQWVTLEDGSMPESDHPVKSRIALVALPEPKP